MKTAIITGGSVGIGAEAAGQFSDRGFKVINLSRRPCPVAGVANIACDLSSEEPIEQACSGIADIVAASEQVALVHNACQMRKDSALNCSSESLREVLETNLIAINSINQRLLPIMPAGSSVLYIGSTLSEKAVAGTFSYVVSKHALAGMMKASCQDLIGTGIHTALICPGFTDTEMLRTHLDNNAEALAMVAGLNAFDRLINPAEIAELILFAHHSPAINGAVLHANLGQKES